MGTGVPGDNLESASQGTNNMEMQDGNVDLDASGDMTAEQLLDMKRHLEEKMAKLTMDVKDKNEKILDLMENIEDLKVEIYSRDRALELQQEQMEELKNELSKAKKFEHLCKSLEVENRSLKVANEEL